MQSEGVGKTFKNKTILRFQRECKSNGQLIKEEPRMSFKTVINGANLQHEVKSGEKLLRKRCVSCGRQCFI